MKYKAVIETDDYKDFEFFEDDNGKYMAGNDANATRDEWIRLYFTECKQEPCDDYISRQATLAAMQKNHRTGGRDVDGDYIEGNYKENLYDDIISLPSQYSRWIPVSEGLPKVADCYAVTRDNGDDLIVSACYFDGRNSWHDDTWINYERNYLTDIVAWMPLPRPYEVESEDEK